MPRFAAHQAARRSSFTSIRPRHLTRSRFFEWAGTAAAAPGGFGGLSPNEACANPSQFPTPRPGLIDCDWQSPVSVVVGADWLSGVYLAKLEESVGHRQSYIIFVVRDDNDGADVVFELPVNTYQAYNFWGGRSAYAWGCGDGLPWGSTARPRGGHDFLQPAICREHQSGRFVSGWAQASSCAMSSR